MSLGEIAGALQDIAARAFDPRAELLELLKREYSAEEVALCDSGTTALTVAIRAARKRSGAAGPVALPAFSCFDLATAAVGAEASVVFYDLDPETLGPDPTSFLAALRRGARCAVVSPLFGIPVEWNWLAQAADAFGAILIEDAAQGHGAFFRGRRLGSLGSISVLSFGRGKGWSAGRGGAVMARRMGRPTLPEFLPRTTPGESEKLRLLLSAIALAVLSEPSRYWIPASLPWLHLGETVYHPPTPGSLMTLLAAALALRTRRSAAREAEARRKMGMELQWEIAPSSRVRLIRPPNGSTVGYLRFPLLLASGLSGFASPSAARSLGMESSYPIALPDVSALRAHVASPVGLFPGAEALARQLVTLPTHSSVTRSEVRQLLRLVHTYRSSGPGLGSWGHVAYNRRLDGKTQRQSHSGPLRIRRPE